MKIAIKIHLFNFYAGRQFEILGDSLKCFYVKGYVNKDSSWNFTPDDYKHYPKLKRFAERFYK